MLSQGEVDSLKSLIDSLLFLHERWGEGEDVEVQATETKAVLWAQLDALIDTPSLANSAMEPEKPGGEGIHDCGNPNCMVTDWERLDRERESVDLEARVLYSPVEG